MINRNGADSGWKLNVIQTKDGKCSRVEVRKTTISFGEAGFIDINKERMTNVEKRDGVVVGCVKKGDFVFTYNLRPNGARGIRFETDHINPADHEWRREGETTLDAFSGKINSASVIYIFLEMEKGIYPLESCEKYNKIIQGVWSRVRYGN